MRETSQGDGIIIAFDDVIAAAHAQAQHAIAASMEMARSADVNAEGSVVVGEPATTIAKLALEKNVTSIVMAMHGRTGLKGLFLAVLPRESCVAQVYPR